MITKENFKQILEQLGFYTLGNDEEKYQNTYGENSDSFFALSVDFTQEKFVYPDGLTVNRATTLDFHQNESFVVFECLHRLFTVGYRPENICLEGKNYQGHDLGWIDILVKDNSGTEYIIIECKTSDSTKNTKEDEFTKHWKKTLNNGDQLFRYFNTYSKAQYLCLYTADFIDEQLVNTYHLITLKDNEHTLKTNSKFKSYAQLRENQGSAQEFFEVWKNTYGLDFSTNGLLEKDAKPFDIGNKKYSIDDLKEIDSSSMQKKYHQFATILRKYNVSSKENAFDKLVNLFLAKIVDEISYPNELKCLWKGAAFDNYYDMQDRLQSLYKKGMEEFFKDTVAHVDNSEIEKAFSFLKSQADEAKNTILGHFRTLKYYNNNPFAFLDVHNESLFYQNAVILKEIVNMIQDIKIKNQTQNQFLGDLFEGFLDQGIKQSEGQFFTPMPIVKFLISSLPLENLIYQSTDIPKVIDYACGAGHFLTEYANQIKPLVEKYKKGEMTKYHQHIHGIEKEYRLSKVSQVSAFMYGQDGIQIFYKDALATNPDIQENSYSVLIANPPYSVKGFLQTLNEEDRNKFELFNSDINLDSNNSIETFFIERAKQLLKPRGIAAIILPSSVLSNGNIYSKCREIIFKYFDIVAIFESGSGTFGKTGTNTATLFLQKKEEKPSISQHYTNRVETWFAGDFDLDKYYEDFELLEKYCSHLEISVEDYKTLLVKQPNENLLQHELFKSYIDVLDVYSAKGKSANSTKGLNENAKKIRNDIRNSVKNTTFKKLSKEEQNKKINEASINFIVEIEKEKLYFFMLLLSNPCKVVCVKSPEKKAIKEFLGYEWSDTKGNEGIKYINVQVEKSEDEEEADDTIEQIKGINGIQTPLFNPKNFDDVTKINTIIRSNFEGKALSIPEHLAEFVKTVGLVDMIDFTRTSFDKAIRTSVQSEKAKIESKYPLVKLGEVAEISRGASPRPINLYLTDAANGVNWIKIGDAEFGEKYITNTSQKITKEGALKSKAVIEGDFIISNSMSVGRPFIMKTSGCIHDGWLLLSNILEKLKKLYLYHILCSVFVQNQFKDNAVGGVVQNLNTTRASTIQIPLPPLDIQQKIVDECEAVDKEYEEAQDAIVQCKNEISSIMENVKGEEKKLGEICKVINPSKTDIRDIPDDTVVSFVEMSSISNDGGIEVKIDKNLGDLRKGSYTYFSENDIIIAKITPCMENGKCAIAKQLTNKLGMGSSEFHVFRIKDDYSTEFVFTFLNRKQIREEAEKVMTGSSGHRRVPINFYKDLSIPVPPLAEQQKIVEQITALEQQIAAAKKTIADVPAKKQAILDRWL